MQNFFHHFRWKTDLFRFCSGIDKKSQSTRHNNEKRHRGGKLTSGLSVIVFTSVGSQFTKMGILVPLVVLYICTDAMLVVLRLCGTGWDMATPSQVTGTTACDRTPELTSVSSIYCPGW